VFPWRQGPLVPHSTQSSRIPGSAVSLQDPAIQPQQMDVASLMAHLAAGPDGLSAAEAHERLVKDGANVLPEAPRRAGALRLAAHLVNPFALLLWTGAGLAALGESFSPGEGMDLISAALIMVVVVNGAFSFWQETRVERAMAAFVGMLSHQARVVRGGEELQIPSADVVCGDVMILRKGDRVPADGRLITSVGLKVDNAILTGESEPQLRTIQPLQTSRLGARNLVFSGTLVTAGFGKAVVYATGRETEIGRIAVVTREISRVDTPIRNELRHFVRVITAIAVMLGCLFFTMGWALGNPFWTNLVFAIGIIVANVPEGLLPTVTLALALSGRRMAKRNALLKTLESAETMGSTTVICTDKTGTITQNRMTVTDLVFPSSEIEEDLGRKNVALRIMALCNNATVNRSGDRTPFFGDPTEVALLSFAESLDPGRVALMRETHPRLYERPFDSQTKEMATIHAADSSVSGDLLVVDLKGAPEVVLKQCGLVWASSGSTFMTQQVMNGALEATEAFARQGKRVLALATKELSATPSQSAIGDLEAAWDEMCVQGGYSFVGLVAMCDPPRPEVAGAVRRCHEAGIRVIVVSGDHPRTVEAVAREIGIAGDRPPAASEWLAESGAPKAGQPQVKEIQVVTGEQLRNMSQPALRKILQMENVLFARTSPLDKYRIVECLQSLNHVVAVTGDGVNDAPALKRADVGIAMGLTGTDVAREAADVVLFDDNFASIVAAVEEGRMIYGNIRRFIGYVLTSNVPEIIPYIAFVLADIPLPLPVLLILAIDLGTDLAPAIALANEPVEADVMLQPPRARTERLLSFSLLGTSYLVWGPIETLAGFAAYFFTLAQGGWTPGIRLSTQDPVYRQSIAAYFAAIVLCQIANVMSWRTSNESLFTKGLFTNKAVLMGIAVEMTLLFGIVSTDLGNEIFNTLPFAGSVWLVPAPFVCLVLLVPELLKWRKRVRLERRLALFGGSHA
jgi:sodium/potassium-transporting ATPase subunit alpha